MVHDIKLERKSGDIFPVRTVADPEQRAPRITDPVKRRARLWKEIGSPTHTDNYLKDFVRDLFPFTNEEKASALAWLRRQAWDVSSLDIERQGFLACLCVGCELSLQETCKQLPGIAIRSDTISHYFRSLIRSSEDELLFTQERTKYALLLTENSEGVVRRRGYDILLDVSKTSSDWHFLSDLFGEPTTFDELGPGHIHMFLGRCPKEVIPQRFFETLTIQLQTTLKATRKCSGAALRQINLLLTTTERLGSESDLLALAQFFWEWFTFDAPEFVAQRTRAVLPANHPLLQARRRRTTETLLSDAAQCGWTVLPSNEEGKLVFDKGDRRVHYYLSKETNSR